MYYITLFRVALVLSCFQIASSSLTTLPPSPSSASLTPFAWINSDSICYIMEFGPEIQALLATTCKGLLLLSLHERPFQSLLARRNGFPALKQLTALKQLNLHYDLLVLAMYAFPDANGFLKRLQHLLVYLPLFFQLPDQPRPHSAISFDSIPDSCPSPHQFIKKALRCPRAPPLLLSKAVSLTASLPAPALQSLFERLGAVYFEALHFFVMEWLRRGRRSCLWSFENCAWKMRIRGMPASDLSQHMTAAALEAYQLILQRTKRRRTW